MELPAGLVPPGPAHGNTISHAPGFGTLGGGRAPFGRTQVPSSRPYGHRPTSAQHRKLQAFGHQIPDSFTAISESQYRDLLSHSLRVDAHDHQASPSAGQMVRQKVIKHVEVPVIHEHTVPVERDVVNRTTRTQKIKGSRMVERHAHKEVTEMQVEVQEEEVEGTRMVWKLVPEPCTHVVKKPVLVPKTRQVPYTYYEPEEVEYEVEVPCEVVHRQQGHRVDQVLGAKTVACRVPTMAGARTATRPTILPTVARSASPTVCSITANRPARRLTLSGCVDPIRTVEHAIVDIESRRDPIRNAHAPVRPRGRDHRWTLRSK